MQKGDFSDHLSQMQMFVVFVWVFLFSSVSHQYLLEKERKEFLYFSETYLKPHRKSRMKFFAKTPQFRCLRVVRVASYVCMYVWMDGWMDGWIDV